MTLWPLVVAYPVLAWVYLTRTSWITARSGRARLWLALTAWLLAPADLVLVLLPLVLAAR